jgi:hypothetical protein
MRPFSTTWDGKVTVLYNAHQLTKPQQSYVLGDGAVPVRSCGDMCVLQHASQRNGFTSNTWHPVSFVGVKPGVEATAKIYHRRNGVVPLYNEAQLVWPIPVPEPPHHWSTGGCMLPHEQNFFESARKEQGFTTRVWTRAGYHERTHNVRHDAIQVIADLGFPFGKTSVLNVGQLINPRIVSPTK